MKSFRRLLPAALGLLLWPAAVFAQTYSAGVGAGTSGSFNVFVGAYAGRTTLGVSNSFLGYTAGYSNLGGRNNSFLGAQAGYFNSTGNNNSFLGTAAGFTNRTGSDNSFVGFVAGYYNTSGASNSFMGSFAGFLNETGNNNSFMGFAAGASNTAGSLNTFAGYKSGNVNRTGNENAFFGSEAGRSNATGGANTYIGTNAGVSATTGSSNTMLGKGSGYRTSTGAYNTFVGRDAGGGNTTGSGHTFVGYLASMPSTLTNLANASAFGFRARVTTSNALVLGAINGVNGATADTKVGIRTTAPAYTLHVNGTAAKPGGGNWTVASDRRLKQDIGRFSDGLEVLLRVKPVTFHYNGKAGIHTDKQFVGVIAQDMQQIAPYTVGEFRYEDSTGKTENYLDYDANALTYILVNSVQELHATNQVLQGENEALKNDVSVLEARLTRVEAALARQLPKNTSAARLYQNQPNPYGKTTTIKYFVPPTATSAQLKIFSVTGQEIHRQALVTGQGEVTLSAQSLAPGTYVYHLLVDGKETDHKKLVISY